MIFRIASCRFTLFCLIVAIGFSAFSVDIVNPILPGNHPDPSACRANGKFCLALSSLQYFPALPLFESDDMANWRHVGYAVDRPDVLQIGGECEFFGVFAPTLRFHDGMFYLVFGGNVKGPQIMTAERLEGPWSKPRKIENAPNGGDPSIDFIDDKCYFTCTTSKSIILARFDHLAGRLLEPPREVWKGTGGIWPEGPHVFKRGEWFYLMIAEGGTEYGHSEVIARSRSVYGPYDGCPFNPIAGHARLKAQGNRYQAVGHGDFVYAENGQGWFICHAIRPQYGRHHVLGRETIALPVEWTDDGWPLVNGGNPAADKVFNTNRLPAPSWTWIRNPKKNNFRIGRPWGEIDVTPSPERLDGVESPPFAGTWQTAFRQTFVAVMAEPPGDDVEAGVAAYMGRTHHYALCVSRRGKSCFAYVRYRLGSMSFKSKEVEIASFPAELRIEATEKSYRFLAGTTLVGEGDVRHISCETNSDSPYGGVLLGVFAEGPSGAERVRFHADLR